MSRRPHPKLDPEHATTLSLAEELRYQYSRAVESNSKTQMETDSWQRSSKEEPPERDASDDPEHDEKMKRVLASVRKARNGFQASFFDTKIKLGKYHDNKYNHLQTTACGVASMGSHPHPPMNMSLLGPRRGSPGAPVPCMGHVGSWRTKAQGSETRYHVACGNWGHGEALRPADSSGPCQWAPCGTIVSQRCKCSRPLRLGDLGRWNH